VHLEFVFLTPSGALELLAAVYKLAVVFTGVLDGSLAPLPGCQPHSEVADSRAYRGGSGSSLGLWLRCDVVRVQGFDQLSSSLVW